MKQPCVIGVDLGGTKLLAGVVDDSCNVHARIRRPVFDLTQPQLLATIVDSLTELQAETDQEIVAVGFGIPALLNFAKGIAVVSVNLPVADFSFRDHMQAHLNLPTFVDNDANVAMIAEHRFGSLRGVDDAVLLTIGTGIGGGLLLGGELYRGMVGSGAELGHMVIEVDGPHCQGNCPNHGCLESLASGTALEREAATVATAQPNSALGQAQAAGKNIDGTLVAELAHAGDLAARDVMELIGRRLGVGVANCVNIFNPSAVVLGGGVMGAGELLLEPVKREVARRALPPSRDLVQVLPAQFGADAGMIGAAALAFEGLEA